MKKYLILLLAMPFLALQCTVSAQAEINLKVKEEEPALSMKLREQAETLSPVDLGQFKQAYPFLNLVEHVAVLTPAYHPAGKNIFTLTFHVSDPDLILPELRASGLFEFAEQNYRRNLHVTEPADPRVEDQYYHQLIRTFEAWDYTSGNASVLIGILDTGLDYEHPEFDGQLAVNPAEDINGNGKFDPWPDSVAINGVTGDLDGMDADQNGYTDDVIGFDFTDQPRSPFGGDYLFMDPDPLDDNAHGTIVAGIVGAKSNNIYGGSGIAPGCRMKVLRAFSASGTGEDDDIARAIIYAADNGIKVLNFSFGDIYPSKTMHAAIRYAYSKGVVMIASAGNGTGDEKHYPSDFDEVISVSASAWDESDGSEYLWPLSSYGTAVSLAAPGSAIFTTTLRDTSGTAFGEFSGTSTAAPMVTAAAALIISQRGDCSPQQVRGILTASADDISDDGWDHFTGAGRLNIEQALQHIGSANVQILSPQNDAGSASDTVWITGTVFDPAIDTWSLEYQSGAYGADSWLPILSEQNQQKHRDTLAIWHTGSLADGIYTLRLRVDRKDGQTMEDRIRFYKDTSPPVVEIKLASPAWDNDALKMLIIFRSSDIGTSSLHFRPLGGSSWQVLTSDRNTHNGDFLIEPQLLTGNQFEYFVRTTNPSGLSGQSPVDTFSFSDDYISSTGFSKVNPPIANGSFLPFTTDFDQDGLLEVVVSRFGDALSYGKLMCYEYNAVAFAPFDSAGAKPVLIPKDVKDTDGNGRLELLASVNDSIYLFEQTGPGKFPDSLIYQNFNNSLYPAKFADTDGDNQQEMVVKDFQDYFIFEGSGSNWSQAAALPDVSPDYAGSTAPRIISADFDQDGLTEIIYGDYDGDLLIYEHDGSGNYQLIFTDTTELEKSAGYLAQGDFDGDGFLEFFVATHSSLLRNSDFEYDTPYWILRIFEASSNDTYEVVWTAALYDIDTDGFNASTAGNMDADAADEIIFSTFPRTYFIDHTGTDYAFRWFHYGALANSHVIGDFNGNGVNEFALGLGDSAVFYEAEFNFAGPFPPPHLEGKVTDSAAVVLKWHPSWNATDYRIWRGIYNPAGTSIGLIDSTAQTSYTDTGLMPGETYLYVLESKNASLTPAYSEFSFAILLTPHARPVIDTVVAISDRQLKVTFSEPVTDRMSDLSYFTVNDTLIAETISSTGDSGRSLIISFSGNFVPGTDTLRVDTLFTDQLDAYLHPAASVQPFSWYPDSTEALFLTHWEQKGSREAVLWFNQDVDASALNSGNYMVDPAEGRVAEVRREDNSPRAVRLTLDKVVLGAGYPVAITVLNVVSLTGDTILEKEGNVALFVDHKDDLSEVYAYPNPWKSHDFFNGIRFGNLTRTATIEIYSASGRKVAQLQETDGDGGLTWDMINDNGERIKPGVYVYKVVNGEDKDFLGKFAVIE